MEFPNRNVQQAAGPAPHPQHVPAPSKKRALDGDSKWTRIGVALSALVVAILLAGVITLLISTNNDKGEAKYVDGSKLQAVFLNTGQVYFGNIKTLNSQYLVMSNIYYLQTANSNSSSSSSTNSNTNVSLVKLGCELHEPYDQMVINSDQITFWENLQDNGQVAKAVSTFEKQNPDGQKCSDQSSSASTDSGTNVQSAGTSNTGTTNNKQ